MRNKHGNGYISTCILVIILCMLVAVFITFTTTVSMVRTTEENSKIVLDSFVMKNSIFIYDSIKNGNNNTTTLDENAYIAEAEEALQGLGYSVREINKVLPKLKAQTFSGTEEVLRAAFKLILKS